MDDEDIEDVKKPSELAVSYFYQRFPSLKLLTMFKDSER